MEEQDIDINGNIDEQIELILYDKYNRTFCDLNEYLGEVYAQEHIKDLKYIETAEKCELYKQATKKLQQELSKYKDLYQKALDNAIKLDRELMKYKEANKKAIEYIKHSKFKRKQLGVSPKGLQEFEVQDLLKILEGEEDE